VKQAQLTIPFCQNLVITGMCVRELPFRHHALLTLGIRPLTIYLMANETPAGPGGQADRSRSPGRDSGKQSPLQARTQFLKNWDWNTVIRLNRGACERGKAQHGFNPETQEKIASEWEQLRRQELSFADLIDFLRHCHRSAPFLFFNGNRESSARWTRCLAVR
jgi:hypothetical protein